MSRKATLDNLRPQNYRSAMYHDLEVCRTVTPDGVATVCLIADSLLDSSVVFELSKQESLPLPSPAHVISAESWGMVRGLA